MALIKKVIRSKEDLVSHIKTHAASFYYSSQTSTVIPYDHLEEVFKEDDFYLVDLSLMPKKMQIIDQNILYVEGAVSWKDAKEFLSTTGHAIKTSPTEELALITAGASTSATGERYFCFGNLRSQISKINYINHLGKECELSSSKQLKLNHLESYSETLLPYKDFKNPPFPLIENETDLMIGSEGQLGVITSLHLDIVKDEAVQHMFMLLPKWEDDIHVHLEILEKIQAFREHTHICEFIDSNSFDYLKEEDRPNQGQDALFFEVKLSHFDDFYESFLSQISIDENHIFEISSQKFHQIRAGIPRAVFETNSHMGVKKMGTDVQVKKDQFSDLLKIYQEFTKIGVRYNLFGHFGDAHLHFNFMPLPEQSSKCQKELENLYKKVKELSGSPFAEHGIGIIKQNFIKEFWDQSQYDLFKELKDTYDPHRQFFPQGFMCLKP